MKWEQEGFQDQEALLAFLVHREYRELKEDQGLKEMRDLLDPLGQQECLGTRARSALQVL